MYFNMYLNKQQANTDTYTDLLNYLQTHFNLLKKEFLFPFRRFIKRKLQPNYEDKDIIIRKMVSSYTQVNVISFNSVYEEYLFWLSRTTSIYLQKRRD